MEALRLEAGVPSFHSIMRREAALALERSLRLPEKCPRFQVASSRVGHRTARSSWRKVATQVVDSVGLSTLRRESFPPPTSAPWGWRNGSWSVALSLRGGSCADDPDEVRCADAVDSIQSLGQFDLTVYVDGSTVQGTNCGGSAAVVTCGAPMDPATVAIRRKKGVVCTSSFETEVEALCLALEWLVDAGGVGRFLICSDSLSTLKALESGGLSRPHWGKIGQLLRRVRGEVVLQWVPGHCGLPGNELADQAAREVALLPPPGEPGPVGPASVSFSVAKALIRERVKDPAPVHERTRLVYDGTRTPFSGSRKCETTMAQLRSGHSNILAAYRHRLGLAPSPTCPHCEGEVETLEHWLRGCPATEALRVGCFGVSSPPLSWLCRKPEAVALYLRGLRLL